jgi:hypothetical protein
LTCKYDLGHGDTVPLEADPPPFSPSSFRNRPGSPAIWRLCVSHSPPPTDERLARDGARELLVLMLMRQALEEQGIGEFQQHWMANR